MKLCDNYDDGITNLMPSKLALIDTDLWELGTQRSGSEKWVKQSCPSFKSSLSCALLQGCALPAYRPIKSHFRNNP